MKPAFRIELLTDHDRSAFACAEEALTRYFRSQVTQDMRRRVTNCFVAVDVATGTVAGYYTICAASIPTPDLPESITKKLPRYPSIPAVRIGRRAVDEGFRGLGLGSALLSDAATKGLKASAVAYALLVDAKGERAVAFYEHHGFLRLTNHPLTLFLPFATLEKARIGAGGR